MSGLRSGTRIAIKGAASPEEVAAVVVALDRALARPPAPARRPGWREAARHEAVGARVYRSAIDLRQL